MNINTYFQLTKPKIALLLMISTIAGMIGAWGRNGAIHWNIWLAILIGGYLCAGGASSMNCYLDRDLDLAMKRTRNRPLPSGKLKPVKALVFSIIISLLSIPFFLNVSVMVALLGTTAWVYYVIFYSMFLKKRTPQNIVVGGAAGAFPPLIGWVGVSGSIDLSSIFLFLIIFFWTPPHAYALMLVLKEDYKNANVPMMPVVKGEKETVRQIIIYSIVFLAITIVPGVIGLFGMFYLISVIILGVTLLLMSIKLFYNLTNKWAFRVYRYSTIQLALLFIALVIDQSVIG